MIFLGLLKLGSKIALLISTMAAIVLFFIAVIKYENRGNKDWLIKIPEHFIFYHDNRLVFWILGIFGILLSFPTSVYYNAAGYSIPLNQREEGTYFYYAEIYNYDSGEYYGKLPVIVDVDEEERSQYFEGYYVTHIAFPNELVSVELDDWNDSELEYTVLDDNHTYYDIHVLNESATIPGMKEKTTESMLFTMIRIVVIVLALVVNEVADATVVKQKKEE